MPKQKESIIKTTKRLELNAKKEVLIEILLDYGKNQLEGKEYDFYFALNIKLDQLKQKLNKIKR